MSIRLKISLILGIVLITVVMLNVGVAYYFILPNFEKIEEEKAKTNIERIQEAYNNELSSLESKLSDWANWDDSYEFIIDRNEKFIESNIQDVSMETIKIDYMIFLNSKGEPIYEKGYDYEKQEALTDFSGWSEYYNDKSFLTPFDENKSKKGLITINDKLLIFASHPILTSDALGPNRGTLIFAKHFDQEETDKLIELTKLDIGVKVVDNSLEPHAKEIVDNLGSSQESIKISKKNADFLEASLLLNDFFEKPSLLIGADLPRDIYQRGVSVINYFTIFSAALSLIVLIIISQLLEFIVLKKIIKFDRTISEIAKTEDFSKRIDIKGRDEISNMSKNANFMLEKLSKSSYSIRTEHQKSKAYLEVMGTMLLVLDLDGNINFMNQRARSVLGIASKDPVDKNWFLNFVPEESRKEAEELFKNMIKNREKSIYNESCISTKDGEKRLIAWHKSVLKDGLGNVIGVIFSGDDITVKKEQERKEKEQAKELKKANELMMGRELRIVELKKEIKNLRKEVEMEQTPNA